MDEFVTIVLMDNLSVSSVGVRSFPTILIRATFTPVGVLSSRIPQAVSPIGLPDLVTVFATVVLMMLVLMRLYLDRRFQFSFRHLDVRYGARLSS